MTKRFTPAVLLGLTLAALGTAQPAPIRVLAPTAAPAIKARGIEPSK